MAKTGRVVSDRGKNHRVSVVCCSQGGEICPLKAAGKKEEFGMKPSTVLALLVLDLRIVFWSAFHLLTRPLDRPGE